MDPAYTHWIMQVEAIARVRLGLTPRELAPDDVLRKAFGEGESPAEFVERMREKLGLDSF